MPENISRSRGRPEGYKLDRGGVPAESGPFLGVVKSNVDPTRSGRLQVYIEAFADSAEDDESKWTTVSYMPPFYGATPLAPAKAGSNSEVGKYPGNQNSYGMWFTPPDLGITVMCMFVNGDRSQGFYIGVVPDQGVSHMVPAIGAESNFDLDKENKNQKTYFEAATQLPVTEINVNNEAINNDPRFFEAKKPVHSYLAAAMFQQGLITDPERGPIRSSSQRETPSAVFGISTPGTAIYQGGMKPQTIRAELNAGKIKPAQAQVIGRVGGHTLVMDDGDLEDNNALFRLRTSKGHQITMNDTGDFFYIIHANGQTWLEFGSEGTVDIFSTNSINMRTYGDINFHADRDINMFAGRDFSVKSKGQMQLESMTELTLSAQSGLTLYSKAAIGVKADGTVIVNSEGGGWDAGGSLALKAGTLDLNGPPPGSVAAPPAITKTILDDTKFSTSTGWAVKTGGLDSIVSRAPTHEPYPYHNKGVDVAVDFESGQPTPPPGAEPVPPGVEISAQ